MSMQYTPPDISEDCLYLNVYVPPDSTSADKLAVGQRDIGVDKITETPNSVDAIQLMMSLPWTEFLSNVFMLFCPPPEA